MYPDDKPKPTSGSTGRSRTSASGMWQAPSVEEMQAMLPQYEILEILGRGGMGAVYKGRQKSLKRLVAIKILPPDAGDDEMKFVERFENEAQTMAAMNHPAIVAVYDFGETAEGLLYFIMEFVDGTDVHKMIQANGKLGDDYALAITAHVCDALDYAHSRGVIHRDIKPANILIDQEGRVKVADFGLAKMHDPSLTSGLTRTNMAMGTPDYVAPEVLTMGMAVDHRADLYAVGVMLYQMLTGEVPRGMFRMPSEKGIGSDPRFDDIICKAMEQDRDERYQTAGEVRCSLDEIITTPLPKNDGTGVVPAEEIPKRVVLNVPGASLERSGGAPAGGSPPPSQSPLPKKAPGKKVAGKGAPGKGAAAPVGKSSTGLWVTVAGVVAATAVASLFLMGGRTELPPGPVPSSEGSVDAKTTEKATVAPTPRPNEQVSGSTNTPPTTTTGKTIDLLALVDVERDAIAGEWRRDGSDLAVTAATDSVTGKGTPRLQLRYQPPEEYDFEIEFTPDAGSAQVFQILSASRHSFAWLIDANLDAGKKAGFDRIDGEAITARINGTKMKPQFLTNGRRHRSTVEVRKDGVRGFLDGELLVKYGTSPEVFETFDSAPSEALRDTLHLGLAARDRAVRFHKVMVREITGTGKVDPET